MKNLNLKTNKLNITYILHKEYILLLQQNILSYVFTQQDSMNLMFSYKNTIVMKAHINVKHLNGHITALIVFTQNIFSL